MYCANPDFETVERNSNNNVFCMGAIGEIYKKMGGNVIIKGKPDVSIYTATTNQINLEKKRTVAIGDSLFHDIQGANNFEIDSVLVKSGIHKDLNQIYNLIKNNEISLLINTTEGKESIQDSSSIRRTALDNKIPCTTTLQGGLAICEVLEKRLDWSVQNIQDIHKSIE